MLVCSNPKILLPLGNSIHSIKVGLILALLLPGGLFAQEFLDLKLTNSCNYYGEIDEELFAFRPNILFMEKVEEVLQAAGQKQNFELYEANVESIVAVVEDDKRYLLYNMNFFNNLKYKWVAYGMLAHEIGHHANEHTLSPEFMESEEAEADEFMGYVLSKLSAGLQQSIDVTEIQEFNKEIAASDRAKAITKGWKRADAMIRVQESLAYFTDDRGQFNPPIPRLDWPPPTPSSKYLLPDALFNNQRYLRDIDKQLSGALDQCGYHDKSYYYIPGGFALITRLEQFNRDGTPKSSSARWSTKPIGEERFSLTNYLRSLFVSEPGYFRIFVMIVSNKAFNTSGETVSRQEAIAWLSKGANVLPEQIGSLSFNPQYKVTTLVYEFKVPESDRKPVQNQPSLLSAKEHLQRAALMDAMK